ncbi:MAG: MBL fold metallo-hydrolase [Syntrophaceae bacterium]|nr:MBL fold metallo-hydrolase [Syntrophaceae bacterium]
MQEIADRFYRITLPMPFRLQHVHIYALLHEGRVTLFDTGMNSPEAFAKLERSLSDLGCSVRDVERIFISHHHTDHLGMAGRIRRESGAEILFSEASRLYIRENANQERLALVLRDFYAVHGLPEKALAIMSKLLVHFRNSQVPFDPESCPALQENHAVYGRPFRVYQTPGHTRGHVVFFFPEEGLLLSGDHVLPDITPNLSPDLFDRDFRVLRSFLASLREISTLPVQRIWPAHGEPFNDLQKRVAEILLHHEERKSLVLASVRKGRRQAVAVSADLFGPDLPDFDQFLALNETYVHLVELVDEGLVAEDEEGDRLFYLAR